MNQSLVYAIIVDYFSTDVMLYTLMIELSMMINFFYDFITYVNKMDEKSTLNNSCSDNVIILPLCCESFACRIYPFCLVFFLFML